MSFTTLAGAAFAAVMLVLGATTDAMSFSLRARPPSRQANVAPPAAHAPAVARGDGAR